MGEEGRRLIRIVRSASQRMDQLIVGLLEFSRVPAALHMDLLDMRMLAGAAASEARSQYTGPEAHIDIGDLPATQGDATVMCQVWSNLIGNALKYSAKRSRPHISVSGRIDNGEAIYQVQDNGAGSTCYAGRLFGVFNACIRRRISREPEWALPSHSASLHGMGAVSGQTALRTTALVLNLHFRSFSAVENRQLPMSSHHSRRTRESIVAEGHAHGRRPARHRTARISAERPPTTPSSCARSRVAL